MVNASGGLTGNYGIWDTGISRNWFLGVWHEGKPVHEKKAYSLGTYKGHVVFDLLAESSAGWFAEGDQYRVTIVFADGERIQKNYSTMTTPSG